MSSQQQGTLVVISGPSGSGKSTLLKRFLEEHKDQCAFSVSHTTRKPRPGEQIGREYHFVSLEEMQSMIEAGDFVEHAIFSGNTYGTSKRAIQDVLSTGKTCILDVDMQGVQNIKAAEIKAVFIFIKPPSREVLENRLRGRGTEGEDALTKRLDTAIAELAYAETGAYDFTVVNDDLETAYKQLVDVIQAHM